MKQIEDYLADDAKVRVVRFIAPKITYTIRNIVDVEKDDEGNVILVTEFAEW